MYINLINIIHMRRKSEEASNFSRMATCIALDTYQMLIVTLRPASLNGFKQFVIIWFQCKIEHKVIWNVKLKVKKGEEKEKYANIKVFLILFSQCSYVFIFSTKFSCSINIRCNTNWTTHNQNKFFVNCKPQGKWMLRKIN